MRVRVCVRACLRACVRAWVRACVRVCVCVCVLCVCEFVCAFVLYVLNPSKYSLHKFQNGVFLNKIPDFNFTWLKATETSLFVAYCKKKKNLLKRA